MLGRALRKGLAISSTQDGRSILFGGRDTIAGARVSPTSAMQAAAVYAATGLIAQTIASLPIRFVLRNDTERRPQRPPEAIPLWGRPNLYQTTTSFIETVVQSMLLWGNSYIYPRRGNDNRTVDLWPIDPDRVQIEPINGNDFGQGIRFKVLDWQDIENVAGGPVNMIHIPMLTLPGQIRGMSPIEQAAELIGMSLSTQEHAARFLGEGVHMSGLIEAPGALKADQAKELVQGFNQLHAGGKKAGHVGVLSGGAKFNPITMNPAELQFLEQMKYTDRKIATLFRVPPHMVGDIERSTSWGSGIEEQTIQFVQHTLLPIVRKLEECFEATLLAGTNYQMRFVVTGLLRGSTAARAAYYHDLWNMGVLNADEIRAFEDLPPQPGGVGQVYHIPLNTIDASAPPPVPSSGKAAQRVGGAE